MYTYDLLDLVHIINEISPDLNNLEYKLFTSFACMLCEVYCKEHDLDVTEMLKSMYEASIDVYNILGKF